MSLQDRLSDLITAIGTDYKQIRSWITGSSSGDLTGLTTTDKTSLLAAINEVDAHADAAVAPAASTTTPGVIEIATLAETGTGTDSARAVTPQGVKQETDAVKAAILNSAPAALDTLDELAAALGDDANFAASVTTALAGKQPLDTDLTAIAALVSAADKLPYATGAGTWSLATLTAAGRALIDDADAAAQRATLSVYSQAELGDPDTNLVTLYTAAKA